MGQSLSKLTGGNYDFIIKIFQAAQFSLENILTDVQELEKGMNLTLKELAARQANTSTSSKQQQNLVLKDFADNAKELLTKLSADASSAKAAFTDCLEHYGESNKSMDSNAFFAILLRFINGWKNAEMENEKRKKLEKARQLAEVQNNNDMASVVTKNNFNNKKQAMLISDEIKSRNRKQMIKPEEVKVRKLTKKKTHAELDNNDVSFLV